MPSPKLALATVVALSGSVGCSLVFVDRPPANHASLRYFDCTSGRLAPVADATLAGLMAIGTLGSLSDQGSQEAQATVEASLLTAGALASAVYGFVGVERCRDAKEQLSKRLFIEPAWPPPVPFAAAPPAPFAPRPAADPWLSAGPPPGLSAGPPKPVGPADAGAPEGSAP